MKGSLISLVFVAFTLSALGQVRSDKGKFFLDFGLKGLFGENVMYNSKASFSSDRYLHNPASVGYGGGFKLGLNFNRHIALVGELVYYQFNQVYNMTDQVVNGDGEITYKKKISYSSYEIPIMFRHNNDEMEYVEVGYVYSKMQGISEKNKGKGPSISEDIQNLYANTNHGAVLGFGGYVWGSDNWGISTGLRLRYDFNDIVTSGRSIDRASVYALDSKPKGSTNPFSLNLVLELNYDLGIYMANSGCGHRELIIGG